MPETADLSVTETNATEVLIVGPDVLHAWYEASAVPVPGAEYTPSVRRGRSDGMYRPGKWCRLRADGLWALACGRGLVYRVYRDLGVEPPQEAGANLLAAPAFAHVVAPLYDYQTDALRALVRWRWCRVALATNAGKGAIIALAARWALRCAVTCPVVLCDEIAVWDALEGEIARWAPDISVASRGAGKGAVPPPNGTVALVMVPTLYRRLKDDAPGWRAWWARVGMVLCDEADKATAATWRAVLGQATGTLWRVGFSGTFPDAGTYDDLRLEEMFGPIVVREKNMALVARGISARPCVTLHAYDAAGALPMQANRKWWRGMRGPALRQFIFEQAIVHNGARHALVASLIARGVPTAIVVNRIDHGEQLERCVPGAVFLDGSASAARRREVLEEFQAGRLSVVVVTKILDRGTNRLGTAVDLIFASGEGSSRQTLQRLGRGLRRTGGKEFLNVRDVVDRGHAYLHAAVERRLQVYRDEEFEVTIA